MADETTMQGITDDIADTAVSIFDTLAGYGSLIADALYLVVGGIIFIHLVHRLAAKVIYPRIKNKRFVRVLFGTLYVLVLVIIALLILEEIGVPVQGYAELTIAFVLIGAIVVFFLAPFLPKVPFFVGHIVEINDVFGTVSAIDVFRVTVKQFNGITVTFTTAAVMASQIKNYSDTPLLRIKIKLSVNNDSDLEQTGQVIMRVMREDARVLKEPKLPFTLVTDANASGVTLMAYCWVKNEDWLPTRSDIWLKLVHLFNTDETISMSLPQQEVFFHSKEAD